MNTSDHLSLRMSRRSSLILLQPCAGRGAEHGRRSRSRTPVRRLRRRISSRGLAALHNFQYPLAARAFQRAQAADPEFALAYWGEAMSYDHAVWHEQDLAAARAALAKLGRDAARRGRRRRRRRAKRPISVPRRSCSARATKNDRDRRYALAMEQLHAKYPDDVDATCFYALALLGHIERRPRRADVHARRGAHGRSVRAQPAASRRRALPDPFGRRLRACAARTARGQCVREDRAGFAARSAHDFAHLSRARHVGRDGRGQRTNDPAHQRCHASA